MDDDGNVIVNDCIVVQENATIQQMPGEIIIFVFKIIHIRYKIPCTIYIYKSYIYIIFSGVVRIMKRGEGFVFVYIKLSFLQLSYI